MAPNYYEEARDLARSLAGEGFGDWSERLEAPISEGFTATEILMGLQWQAQQLQKESLPLKETTRQRLESLLANLGEALG